MSEPDASPLPASGSSGLVDNLLGGNWPAQAADKIETIVDSVRIKTTGPAITVSRIVVFGLVAALLGLAALVLVLVTVLRVLDIFLDVWLAYLVLGAVLTLSGLYFWRRALRATRATT